MRIFERPPNAITLLVLYERPRDFPLHYVLRAQHVFRGRVEPVTSHYASLFPTEEAARDFVRTQYPEFTPMAPMEGDDPKIIGTWI